MNIPIVKKARRSVLLFLAAIAAGIVTYFAKSEEPMSDVALANIEALADNEGVPPCHGYGGELCTYNNIWVEYQGWTRPE